MNPQADRISINAPIEHVWDVFTDVERWPQWTKSVTHVERVKGSGVDVGAVVRMKQPRLPVMQWTVTDAAPGQSWTWVARSPGVTTVASHTLTPTSATTTSVEQSIEHRGLFAWFSALATRGLTRRYLRLEGEGLKARCERVRAA